MVFFYEFYIIEFRAAKLHNQFLKLHLFLPY